MRAGVPTLQGALAEIKTENQLLRQMLEFFIKRYFGSTKNERLDPKQLELLLAGLEASRATTTVPAEKLVAPRASVVARPSRQPENRAQLRAAVRAWQSRPILECLRRAMEVVRRRVLPKSLLGQAIDYVLARWEALIRYVDDGRLEIDNNLCENAIRPRAVGKKNFLFICHPEAGQRNAVIYSALGNCRRHGINPDEYLRDVFEGLPKAKTSELKSLTPAG